jgi:putative transposase
MSGRYAGARMSVYGSVIPGAGRLAGLGKELSRPARQRLRWMDHYERHRNASLTCRYFGIPGKTFWKWRKRYQPANLTTLEDRSRRPHRVRAPLWLPGLVTAVQRERERYPRWGKDKLAVLLRREGWAVSTSKVGRILSDLRRRGVLREPLIVHSRSSRRAAPRPYAIRKPAAYRVERPGDLVQLDTQQQRPLPGVTLYHFAARDVISRWDVLAVHRQPTARNARDFLYEVLARMPFAVRALQIDGGSEFKAEFEQACQELAIRLFVLPPHSPKLNGRVERSHRTHEEEFYQCYEGEVTVKALTPALRRWEQTYNTVRPHQALGYLTPAAWLIRWRRHNENRAAGRSLAAPSPV